MGCLNSAKTSVLVNGSPTHEFDIKRGLRQGDPLSHFLYADDVIIFSEWDRRDLHRILTILEIFYLVSGLKINVTKSQIIGIDVDDSEVNSFALSSGASDQILRFPHWF
ncbi:uncharacterized protein [Rutidosis leptorrhynchoides]|uniref:uncharacterized protein n=1 Tax=Rutidosis leptorrhynchoides TaxID=125765 RepID=UPI003A9A3B75